ncbi:head decoration protein [Rhodopila sp.]|uniref:head decoration protein n=1 Tax=Rhodopila sp. TaxID=2480087 RepID=UPI003D0A99B8
MVSPVLTENWYTSGFIVSEAPGKLSRSLGTIYNTGTADIVQEAGLVLAQATTATPTVTAGGANHGNGSVTAITAGNNAVLGAYTLLATSATSFNLTDPNNDAMGPATVGTAYAGAEIDFMINAGGTAFAAGDIFTLTLLPGTGAFVSYTGAVGLPAVGVLYNLVWVPAGGSTKVTVMARNCEVNRAELQWDPSIVNSGSVAALEATALAALATHNIIAR